MWRAGRKAARTHLSHRAQGSSATRKRRKSNMASLPIHKVASTPPIENVDSWSVCSCLPKVIKQKRIHPSILR